MEYSNVVMVLAVGVAMILIVVKLRSLLVTKKSKLNLPPGPWTLPLIGSVHHLLSNPVIHRGLRDLSRKHGPLMMLRLGEVPTLVVSSAEAVTKTHDTAFADRHVNATLAVLTFNGTDLAFGAYDERWCQLRKICVLQLLSAARVRSFQRVREEEVARFVESLAASASAIDGAAVDLTKMISRLINDTFVRESISSRYKHQDEYLDALDTVVQQTSSLTVADLFPSSRLMQMLGTAPRKALACRNRVTRILDEIIREKREAMDRGDKTAAHDDGLLGVLLKLQKEDTLPIPLTDDTIVTLMLDMFGAGSDTSSMTLNWCMTELVRHPAAMSRAQAEVREAFKGKMTVLTEDDLAVAELGYLKLVVKETLRLHCPLPLLIPRRCRETVQVMGYDIPEGTAVFVNAWAVCRDPEYWDDDADAEEFRPERFEEKKSSSMDFKGTNYEFLPFGSARRMCPGINLGLANIELALASLLYHFDWKLPSEMEPKDVDVGETAGLVAKKKTGLVLHPIIRFVPAS